MLIRIIAATCFLVLTLPVDAQTSALATTPPMGWNSWDSYGLTITEAEFHANVDVLASRLKPAGWRYAVIDEGWYLQNPAAKPETFLYTLNDQGQYAPAVNRFPSSAGGAGLKPVGDFVHARGLLFGIHIIRGIPKQTVMANRQLAGGNFRAADAADTTDICPWNPDNFGVRNNAAGQAWYDGLMRQYASWGIDYLKVDCIASHPYKADEIRMIHRAISKSGRPIVLSLSPGPTALENAAEVGQNAQLWRISDDVWDFWDRPRDKEFPKPLKRQFATVAGWAQYAKAGNWPDADMLPLGELRPTPGFEGPRTSRLTPTEQRTMVTLWSISRSPLFMGGNLTLMDTATAALLTSAEVIAVNQHGSGQRQASDDGDVIGWTSHGSEGREYLALFNLGDTPVTLDAPFAHYGLADTSYNIRDLWEKKDVGRTKVVAEHLPPHGSVLLELRR